MYGYQDWTKGDEKDIDTLSKLPNNLAPEKFIKGQLEKSWPTREVNKYIFITPFSPQLNSFAYYFVDPLTLLASSEIFTIKREVDLSIFERSNCSNPILFTAFTEGIGNSAKRYTGMSVLNPNAGLPNFDYPDLEFSKATQWAQ